MTKTSAPELAKMFADCGVMPYGNPAYMLTDNDPQSVAKFFTSVFTHLGAKEITATTYHPPTNWQTE